MVVIFLISSDFTETASVLDDRRLGKQRVEGMQIINSLESKGEKGWYNHPATRSWLGYTNCLKRYVNTIIEEWVQRGYENKMEYYDIDEDNHDEPPWFGCEKVYYSHQARLLQKDPVFYKDKFPSLPEEYSNYGYIWPYKYTVEQLETLPLSELAEPFVDIQFCIAQKKIGGNCVNKAKPNSQYCGLHNKHEEHAGICTATLKNGNDCTKTCVRGTLLCTRHTVKVIALEELCSATLKTGKPCSFRKKGNTDYCGRHQ